MRDALSAFGRNLAAGLRLALFMRVDRAAFRISAAQLVLVTIVSAAIDIDADWLRAAHEARFSLLGLHGEVFALGLLVLSSALIGALARDRELYLALPIVILASFPAIQIVHVLPDLPAAASNVSAFAREIFEYGIIAWMALLAMRAVYVCLDAGRAHRRALAIGGAVLVIAPIWFAPLLGPLDPWFREIDASTASGSLNPASEPVLAAQDFMMDRALDELADERSGEVDLYFVGFAPDARRAGFVADVDAAQRAMDTRWRTNGRSLVLVNSPLTVADRPFATITHLREVLLEIGDIIDADEDVVMIYLAGSPGANHTLAAVNPDAKEWGSAGLVLTRDLAGGLIGGTWHMTRAVHGNDAPVVPEDPSRYTVQFGEDGTLSLRADCNRGRGSYTADPPRVDIGPAAITRMMCPPGSLDSVFLRDLNAAATFDIDDGELHVTSKDGATTLTFERVR